MQWWLQTIVIALVVTWALIAAARRLLPAFSRRWQARVVDALVRSPMPLSLRNRLSQVRPEATTGASCGDGCSACGGCGAAVAAETNGDADARDDTARPLVFHRSALSSRK